MCIWGTTCEMKKKNIQNIKRHKREITSKGYVVHGASKNSLWYGPPYGIGTCRMFYSTI